MEKEKVTMLAQDVFPKVVELRRLIHQHPELSNKEEKTAALVAKTLRELGIDVQENVGGYGVVGLIKGKGPGKTIGLRADMDALPLQEQTGLPYASGTDGVMHACGHDTHTAILLGAAMIFSRIKDSLNGNIKLIFQPAEEQNPTGGALGMIEAGVLDNPKVDCMLALHVWPQYRTGTIISRNGPLMGASDRLYLTVRGSSAHGSAPQDGVDAIVIASQVISALQTIVSRNVSPVDSAVVSIGTIRGGVRYNVIADEVLLEGTVRTILPPTQDKMPKRIESIATHVAQGMGGSCEVKYVRGYPPLVNDSVVYGSVKQAISDQLGADHFIDVAAPELGGEDFSFFAQKVPSTMLWVGCTPEGIPAEEIAPLHNVKFCPDEASFLTALEALTAAAEALLR